MPNILLIHPGDILLSKLQEDLRNKEALACELVSLGLAVYDGRNQNISILRDLDGSGGPPPPPLSLASFDFGPDLLQQEKELLRLRERGAKIVGGEVLSIAGKSKPVFVVAYRGGVFDNGSATNDVDYIVSGADWLNLRKGPSVDDEVIKEIQIGTVLRSKETSPDGNWRRIEFTSGETVVGGWVAAKYLTVKPSTVPTGAEAFSNAHFNTERRTAYVDSICDNPDAFNFLKPSYQTWDSGRWIHGYQEGGNYFAVGVDWETSQLSGKLKIVEPTRKLDSVEFGRLFSGTERSTYCNFNVSYCYQQAYGGKNLQDSNGTKVGGERSANELCGYLRGANEWQQISVYDAARIANAGGFVIVAWQNPSGHGHVLYLLEGCKDTGNTADLRCFHVGGGNPRITTVGDIFGTGKTLLFVTDRETYSQWTGIDKQIVLSGAATQTEFSIESDLRIRVSPLTAERIDAFFRSQSPNHRNLAGIGAAVIDASKKYQINATYIVAHAILESGWGTSSIYKKKNNLFGWSAYDASPGSSATGFASRERCIDFVLSRVNDLYLTPGRKYFRKAPCVGNKSFGMNVCYAAESDWGSNIAQIARQIEKSA